MVTTVICRSDDTYDRIRREVSARDVVAHYGFEVDGQGRMPCPFHNGKDRNLKVYDGDRGYHCFVCGAGGDVVDFVARLFRIERKQAAVRLSVDFRLTAGDWQAQQMRGERFAMAQERSARAQERDLFRAEYMAKIAESREMRAIAPPWEGLPHAGEYAALLGRLDYLEEWFRENEWR